MTLPSSRKWLSLAVLAIIIPIGVLTTFKLTGIIPEPQTIAKTIEAETITWNMTRPSEVKTFHDLAVENFYSDTIASISLGVHVDHYLENSEDLGDSLWVTINSTMQVQKGFIYSVCIRFSQTDDNAFLSIHKIPPWPKTYNLNIADLVTLGSNTQRAYASAIYVDQPEKSSLEIMVSWHFLDPNNMSHWITASLETVYFNGTAYRKVIMPIQLGVLAA
jgi:hypothetical protein